MKAFLNWSGGKDSALALAAARQQGINVELLVTTVNAGTGRVSMHGLRRELLQAQAAALHLPLKIVELPEMPGMQAYEEAVRRTHRELAAEGFTDALFGDIFLEDLKAYREELLLEDGLNAVFPLWKKDTKELLHQFVAEDYKAVVICVNAAVLDKSFCGRELNEAFANDLPAGADPCGENGEYHSFVYDGLMFAEPVKFEKGVVVCKDYPSPLLRQAQDDVRQAQDEVQQAQDDNAECFTTPQPKAAFYFQDLLPLRHERSR